MLSYLTAVEEQRTVCATSEGDSEVIVENSYETQSTIVVYSILRNLPIETF